MRKLTSSPLIKKRENRRWASTSNPALSQEQEMACPYIGCGKIFGEPIELTVRKEGTVRAHYVCPHCFSRVIVSDNLDALNFNAHTTDIKRLYLEE